MTSTQDPTRVSGPLAAPDSAVRDALERVLASTEFRRSARMSEFLRFAVEETLAGRGGRLKAFTIATEVYGRDETFDPRTDTIVRVEAGRLRRRLDHYYDTGGRDDPVRISLPKGGYTSAFALREQAVADGGSLDPPDALRPSPADTRLPWIRTLALAVLAVAAIGAVVWWFAVRSTDEAVTVSTPKVVVLQFSNVSRDPQDAHLANGFTAELIAALSGFDHMILLSRAGAARYSAVDADVREIGRDLGAEFVMRGSIWKDENRLRVTAELADAQSAELAWTGTYDESLDTGRAMDIVKTIAGRVAAAVAKPYGAVYREALSVFDPTRPSEFSAYECLLRGYEYETKLSPTEHHIARACLERAVERDPRFATLWTLLTKIYLDEYREVYNPRREYDPLDLAIESARRAVELAPESADAHLALALAHYFRKEFPQFLENGRRALALGVNNADVIADIGFKLAISGHWEQGLELLDEAIDMSPVHPPVWHFPQALSHYYRKEYEAALARSLKINMPDFYMTYVFRAMSYGQLGHGEEASVAVDQIQELRPGFADDARDDFRRRNVPEAVIEQIVEGLQKAGLEIPPEDSFR